MFPSQFTYFTRMSDVFGMFVFVGYAHIAIWVRLCPYITCRSNFRRIWTWIEGNSHLPKKKSFIHTQHLLFIYYVFFFTFIYLVSHRFISITLFRIDIWLYKHLQFKCAFVVGVFAEVRSLCVYVCVFYLPNFQLGREWYKTNRISTVHTIHTDKIQNS